MKDQPFNPEHVTSLQLVLKGGDALVSDVVGGRQVDEIGGMGHNFLQGTIPPGPEKTFRLPHGNRGTFPLELVPGENLDGLAEEPLSSFDGFLQSPCNGYMGTYEGQRKVPPLTTARAVSSIRAVTPQITLPSSRSYSG